MIPSRLPSPDVSPAFCLTAAFALLIVPVRWVLAWFAAACIHELCHILAIFACGGELRSVRITAGGARLDAILPNTVSEFICPMAGPIGGLLPLFAASRFPHLAICGVIQSFYNLLPLYPMDGGRSLRALLRCVLPPRIAGKAEKGVRLVTLAAIVLAGAYAAFCLHLGIAPLLFCALFFLRSGIIPCKSAGKSVQ